VDTLSSVLKVEPDELRARIAARIRETAKRRRMPLYVVADEAGVSRSHLWGILRGEKSPTGDVLAKLAGAMDVDPSVLVKPYRGKSPALVVEKE